MNIRPNNNQYQQQQFRQQSSNSYGSEQLNSNKPFVQNRFQQQESKNYNDDNVINGLKITQPDINSLGLNQQQQQQRIIEIQYTNPQQSQNESYRMVNQLQNVQSNSQNEENLCSNQIKNQIMEETTNFFLKMKKYQEKELNILEQKLNNQITITQQIQLEMDCVQKKIKTQDNETNNQTILIQQNNQLKLIQQDNSKLNQENEKVKNELKKIQQDLGEFQQLKIYYQDYERIIFEENIQDKKQFGISKQKKFWINELKFLTKEVKLNTIKKYQIFNIKENYNKYKEQLMKNQLQNLEECIILQDYTFISVKYSEQEQTENEYLNGQLLYIFENETNLNGKYLMKVELKPKYGDINSKKTALQLSLNSLICQYLLKQFKFHLTQADIKYNFDIQITEQFIIKEIDKQEYYYCYIIEKGQLLKINGGNIIINNEQIEKFCNSFSLYTYYLLNKQGIITFISIQNQRLIYDMIFSSKYKVISPIDQGQQEIEQFKQIIGKEQQYCGQYFNDKLKNIAIRYFS